MSIYLGIDIGAVSATAAVLADAKTPRCQSEAFHALEKSGTGDTRIYLSEYRRTRGRPLTAALELLEGALAFAGDEALAGVCLTGSGSKLVASVLEADTVNEFKAVATGLDAMGVPARTVFEIGGESSKYLRLAPSAEGTSGIVDYATNGDCAAGTGAFLDQQAGRLKFPVEQIGSIVSDADRAAQIAGRCSVFAKSDMIHAQQKGYSPAEVLRGLCNAVARNFRTAVVRSHVVEAPVVMVGGVAANSAVVQALREVFELTDGQMAVAPAWAHVPAIGAAAVAALGEGRSLDPARLDALRRADAARHGELPTTAPLSMDNVTLLRDCDQAGGEAGNGHRIRAYLGIDVGSVSTNVVVLDEDGQLIHEIYTRTKGRPIEVVTDALREIQQEFGHRLTICGTGTTGSGRELIGELIGADTVNDEITAHKTGATYVGQTMLDGRVPDTIFEIGGQDSKYISLQDGVVVDFTMNEACAAGTGSFLEERAEELDIAIKDEFAELALSSQAPIRLGERCTVFMERDVNSCMHRGADTPDLVAGLAYSVVYNYINRVVRGRKIGESIFFQGGTAYNDAVAAAFAAVTGKEIIVPPHNGVIGAIGSALLARDKMAARAARDAARALADETPGPLASEPAEGNEAGEEAATVAASEAHGGIGTYVSELERACEIDAASRFRGYDLTQVDYRLREFTCRGCSNACQIQEFDVEGEKTYWGDKCSERFRKRVKGTTRPVIEDLVALREKLLLADEHLPPVADDAPSIGIPRTMFALESLPLWRTFFAECGFRVVLSEPTNKRIIQAGLDSVVAEPCFPIIVAHGHVADLAKTDVDHIFLPNLISMATQWMHTESHVCPWHQTLPFVIRRAPGLAGCAGRLLSPPLHFRDGPAMIMRELADALKPLGIPRRVARRAFRAAQAAQDEFYRRVRQAGDRALATLERTGAPGIVLTGRPYNMHDAGMNLSVAHKLREYYGVNVIPMDFLDIEREDILDINANMFWNLGRRILAAAKIVGRRDNLHIISITNFKCGPDSFIAHYIKPASGKPFLTLQFDGHSNDAGMMTRCEAYLDSKGILRPWRRDAVAQAAATT